MNIITLDQNILQALDFFAQNPPPLIDVQRFRSPFVVGSGNAYNTGAILFSGRNAVLADESNFKLILEHADKKVQDGSLKDVVVISASGSKDSVWEIELAKKQGLKTTLLTTKAQSNAAKIADEIVVFKSIPEPYTYNVSTYLGMILGATHENPMKIKEFIENIKLPQNLDQHLGYAFILPDRYAPICPMLDIKKSELFGSYVSLRAFSQGHARHAKFVIRSPEELVISLGQKNEYFGDPNHRWDINLSTEFNFASIMGITYFIVGKIQESKPPYYKENIARYVSEDGPQAYGPNTKPFEVIVPGSTN
ncbi:hypothetical protein HY041_01305 [Candidatus Roizmanbacteria bacterium]|nr:hypothetical protein [Candidatus Roizmanbacteria bacterium]